MKLGQLLTEGYNVYKCEVVLKTDAQLNKTDVFDRLRAIHDVIIVSPKANSLLTSKSNNIEEYTLVNIKFLVPGEFQAIEKLNNIKEESLKGSEKEGKIVGLKQFIIRKDTLKKIY